jgi:hypothetical protein
MPSKSRDELEGYVALARTFEPADAPYLQNHRGHLMFVKPEERPYVTAGLIRATSLTATESEIKTRIDALRGAGYTQFTIQIVPGQEEAIAGVSIGFWTGTAVLVWLFPAATIAQHILALRLAQDSPRPVRPDLSASCSLASRAFQLSMINSEIVLYARPASAFVELQ